MIGDCIMNNNASVVSKRPDHMQFHMDFLPCTWYSYISKYH